MEKILNQELIELVNNLTLSISKIKSLISLREFVNRVSGKQYIEQDDINKIYDKFKAMPTVTTWGDYFQVELVHDILHYSDEDFLKAVDTIKFDIISSYIIFSDKDKSFFELVESWYDDMTLVNDNVSQVEIEEKVHLKILKDYFLNLGLKNRFSKEELTWHESFKEAVAM